MALNFAPSCTGPVLVQVRPSSVLRSKCTRQTLGLAVVSELEGANQAPSGKITGLFFTGPISDPGKRLAAPQVRPLSLLDCCMPHHVSGVGPAL